MAVARQSKASPKRAAASKKPTIRAVKAAPAPQPEPEPEPEPEPQPEDQFSEANLTKVIKDYMPLVRHAVNRIAVGSTNGGILGYEDMVSYGVQGLIEAFYAFDPDKGAKFSTYALPASAGRSSTPSARRIRCRDRCRNSAATWRRRRRRCTRA